METNFCQSCGMPLNPEILGTNADNSKSQDYCTYCYQQGNFTAPISMEEMIDFCIPHMVESNPNLSKEQAKNMMEQFFPTLKRWKK